MMRDFDDWWTVYLKDGTKLHIRGRMDIDEGILRFYSERGFLGLVGRDEWSRVMRRCDEEAV